MNFDNSEIVRYEFNFGSDEMLASKLRDLVLKGEKTATIGLYRKGKEIPKSGELATITDSEGKKFCVVEYTNVEVKQFLEVDFEYAKKEGEGYVSIEEWRDSHREFFKKAYPDIFTDDSLVVCEEFKVIDTF